MNDEYGLEHGLPPEPANGGMPPDLLDEVRAIGWARGFEDELAGKPDRSKAPELPWVPADQELLLAYGQAYGDGRIEARTRQGDLAFMQELDRALSDPEMVRDSD